MTQVKTVSVDPSLVVKRRVAFGVTAVFITQFVSFIFINARNIAQPQMIAEFDGMGLFAWLIALPALAGSASTLLFGKLSDLYGRRAILLTAMLIFGVGLALTTQVRSMAGLVTAASFMSIGHFPIVPLCFSVIGDLFSAAERAKWTGLLNLPTGIAATIGPVLGGVVAESTTGWRGLYWGTLPLLLIAGVLVVMAFPKHVPQAKPKVDVAGTAVILLATTTLIFGFSWVGQPARALAGVILLVVSLAAWWGFIVIEKKAAAPILDPQVLFNRTFLTAATASLFSFFGLLGIMAYSPILVQEVMGISPAISGSMLTPFTMLVAFMGIPGGVVLARTGKYKWMYRVGYLIVTLTLFAMWQFTAVTPIWLFVLVTAVAGFGLGAIPTINTLVAQFAVPRRLLGVAVGAIFFFQMVGLAVAPSILGLAQNSAANLEGGLKLVFLVGAVAMTLAFLLILTIPEVSIHAEVVDTSRV
mgnify:CR=1 FL=1